MPVTSHQRVLVQATYPRLIDNIDTATVTFFDHLFQIDPSLKALFIGEMSVQGRKMIQTLLVIVNTLNDPESIGTVIQETSLRHVTYGVKEEYYQPVGRALIATIRQNLGAECTPEVEAAWAAAIELVSSIAIAAAYPKAET
ncbi:MAG: hemin receptor [Anaerolineae bacterium]|nr:hemin receptor [Anaerolineae bacterium]